MLSCRWPRMLDTDFVRPSRPDGRDSRRLVSLRNAGRGRVMRDEQRCRRHCHRHHHTCLHCLIEVLDLCPLRDFAGRTPAEPRDHAVHGSAADRLAALDVFAHDGEALVKAAANPSDGKAELLRDLAVGQASEVGELHHLPVLSWQLAHRFIDRLPSHRAREVDSP